MQTALEYLKANPVFHLATVDGNRSRVRPFGFVMNRNGKLYFCTNKSKDVFKQLVTNPEIEISDMGSDGTWLRLSGTVVVDDSREAKEQAFSESPSLQKIYVDGADSKTFVTFYIDKGEATLFSFSDAPNKIPLI